MHKEGWFALNSLPLVEPVAKLWCLKLNDTLVKKYVEKSSEIYGYKDCHEISDMLCDITSLRDTGDLLAMLKVLILICIDL